MEIEWSRKFWVRTMQQAWFACKIEIISRNEQLPKSNLIHPLSRLTPFLDQEGLLRIGGRLHNVHIDTESKHPLILPRESPFTKLLIDDTHKRILHGRLRSL